MRRLIPLALLLLLGADEPANLLTDGNFEDPDVGDMYQQFDKGDTIGAWTVESGSVDLTGKWWDAASGKQSLDLNGDKTGSISQQVETKQGESYVVRFAMSGNPDNENPEKATMQVLWDDKVIATVECDREHGKHHAMTWNRYSFAIKGNGDKGTLKFVSTTDGGWGPLIDDVTITQGDVLDDKSPSTQPTTKP
jgi:choice-of-anchor C domain-containing protein